MLSKIILPAVMLFFCVFSATYAAVAQGQQNSAQNMSEEILRLVNQHRAAMRLKPLKMNAVITREAEGHSKNMANKSVEFGHDGFDERSDRIMKKLKTSTAAAENVAYGSRTAIAVVDMWLHSPGHRKNIEGDYDLTGIGIAKSSDGTPYYTQIFIKN